MITFHIILRLGDYQTGFLQATQDFAQYTPTQSAMAAGSFSWGSSQASQTQTTATQVCCYSNHELFKKKLENRLEP